MVIVKVLLFNRHEELQGTLKEITDVFKDTEEINGEDILEITTLDQQVIEKGYRIVFEDHFGLWHEYIIRGIEDGRDDQGFERQLFCESSFYETLGDYIEDKRPSGAASSALEVALQPTRWEVGQVDDLGEAQTNFYHIFAKEAVQKVAETWKGELRTRIVVSGNKITGRFVDLFAKRGNDLGKRFTYTKDLESIIKTTHRDDVITALYGYGKGEEVGDGFGRRIDFKEINDGKAYVENDDARIIWGRNNPDGTRSHIFGKVDFDDIEDIEELKVATEEKLEGLSQPLVTYEARVVDLKAFGFEHEGVQLGDTVLVIDKEFQPEIRIKARVIKIVWDRLNPENTEITLGNFITDLMDDLKAQEDYINNFRGKEGIWDRSDIINADGSLNASYLNGVVDELNSQINADGGYVYITEDGEGLITYDKPADQNPTMAIQLKGGSFRIAANKKPDGSWNWRTFGTGNGFVADEIITGILKGGRVKFDLTNGTFLIGEDTNDYKLWFDGETLRINGIVHIGSDSTFEDGYDPSTKETPSGAQSKADEAKDAAENYAKAKAKAEAEIAKIEAKDYTDEEKQERINDVLEKLNQAKEHAESKADEAEQAAKDYTDKLENSLGDLAWDEKVELAKLGNTIIEGGYLKNSLIEVDDLKAIAARIGGWYIDHRRLESKTGGTGIDSNERNQPNNPAFWAGGANNPWDTDNWTRNIPFFVRNNGELRSNHSDGSYTRLDSKGLMLYDGSTGYQYHHMLHVSTFTVSSSSGRWIQLPDRFKGKNFSVYYAIADSITNPEGVDGSAIHRFVVTNTTGAKLDYARARVPVTGYKRTVRLSNNALSTSSVQGMIIAIF